jgi:hypothetical protein
LTRVLGLATESGLAGHCLVVFDDGFLRCSHDVLLVAIVVD